MCTDCPVWVWPSDSCVVLRAHRYPFLMYDSADTEVYELILFLSTCSGLHNHGLSPPDLGWLHRPYRPPNAIHWTHDHCLHSYCHCSTQPEPWPEATGGSSSCLKSLSLDNTIPGELKRNFGCIFGSLSKVPCSFWAIKHFSFLSPLTFLHYVLNSSIS